MRLARLTITNSVCNSEVGATSAGKSFKTNTGHEHVCLQQVLESIARAGRSGRRMSGISMDTPRLFNTVLFLLLRRKGQEGKKLRSEAWPGSPTCPVKATQDSKKGS